jgi:hypothetical protein
MDNATDQSQAPAQAEKPVIASQRRIVTGHDSDGNSIILSDAMAPNLVQPDATPNMAMIDLWETASTPASNAGIADAADRKMPLSPPKGGTIFRILVLPPEKERDFSKVGQVFAQWGEKHVLSQKPKKEKRYPTFHETNTIDYAIVLEGEVWALMDIGETLMKTGDILIQRGTHHAFANRSDKPVRIAFVLIDAEPL